MQTLPRQDNLPLLLEQYKLFVEMMDRTSQRRLATNRFFLSILTILTALQKAAPELISLNDSLNIPIYLLVWLLCAIWFFQLKAYQQLNGGKFKVIGELEEYFDYAPYNREWHFLQEGKSRKSYWMLSELERFLPIVFALFIGLLLILEVFEINP